MNDILLAGANGVIGTFLYNRLNKNHHLTSLDHSAGVIKNHFFTLDLDNLPDVKIFAEKLPKHETLIFLVGLAHKKGKGKELEEFRRVNKHTLENLLSSLELYGKLPNKIIFASTISIYGEKINQSIYTEESVTIPYSPYAVTKLESEQYLFDNFKDRVWILRFAPVYSSNFLLNINRRTKIADFYFRIGKGTKKFSLCNIENIYFVIQGILSGKIPADIYNISDTKNYTYNDLLKYKNAKWVLPIPEIFVNMGYYIGVKVKNNFLKENSTKLITDHIYPSDKIRNYIELPSSLDYFPKSQYKKNRELEKSI